MSRVNGQLITCDRCGKTTFCKCIGEGETDGGFTRWNKFEKAEGWDYESSIGNMCPECFKLWETLKADFVAQHKEIEEKEG